MIEDRREGSYFPFCSKRCRSLDLGNWLDGHYRLADAEGTASVPVPLGVLDVDTIRTDN